MAPMTPNKPDTSTSPVRRYRVLVVEDEFFLADDISRALTRTGIEVVGPVARSKAAEVLLASDREIDAAVLDVNLNGEMAYLIADELRERGVPFAFATGYDMGFLPTKFHDIPLWKKPFDADEVAAAVAAMARR
jgi:DNA-binding response OmpR family regulator